MRKNIIFILLITFSFFSKAQNIAIGEWQVHLPFSNVIDVAYNKDIIYAANPFYIISYNPKDYSITRYNTVNSLNDVGISAIEFSEKNKTLVISYTNANIDLLIDDKTIVNIPDIKRKNLSGNKTINDITIKDNYAWLACGFGIVILDLNKKEIKETYFIGDEGAQVDVKKITFSNDSVYAVSDNYIFHASLNNQNLHYFGNWKKIDLPVPNAKYNTLDFFHGKLFTIAKLSGYNDDTAYYRENGIWKSMDYIKGIEMRNINISNNHIVFCGEYFIDIYDSSLTRTSIILDIIEKGICPNLAIFYGSGNTIYIADVNHGLIKYFNNKTEVIKPNGPYSSNAFRISNSNKAIAVSAGGYKNNWDNIYLPAELSILSNGNWKYLSRFNFPDFHNVNDIITIAINPKNPNHFFAGLFGKGLYEFKDYKISKIYNSSNSSIGEVNNSTDIVRVAGLQYDYDGNLWIVTTGNNRFISVLKPNGELKTFNFPSSFSFDSATDPVIDQNGYKWIALPRGEGIFVFNDNNTIDITSDDSYKKLSNTIGNGNLPNINVHSIAVDKDNEIWIGTDEGIGVIYNPSNIFNGGNYDAQQILVEVNGFIKPLMSSEKVTAIAVDGANRKWIGTEKAGVFLISEDGTKEIYHFTTENSPLLSDKINGIVIQPENGEVFFATDNGIISYRGTATEAREKLDSVLVFPNPVQSGYNGPISISGLVENASVTITDTYGTLIYKTKAFGGQAIWNGLDMSGDRPASGVYLVFITNDDGSIKKSSKIMFYH
ncbi:MAG: T9SS type A sorting domain-containing protein [Bacteroidales bacterium]|nr:T9SS type A sorting domain-containing protein [Bacteroidales bacterium]